MTDRRKVRQLLHDLSGELFLIRGNAELTAARLSEDPKAVESLQKIVTRVDAIVAISDQLRQAAGVDDEA